MSTHQKSSLAQIAIENGDSIPCAGNLPLDMSSPLSIWYVEKGTVDLFLIETENGIVQAAQQHVLRGEAGRLLFGVAKNTQETTFTLSAKGLPGTQLRHITWTDLESVDIRELAFQVDCWVADVSSILSRYNIETTRPQDQLIYELGHISVSVGDIISTQRNVAWVSGLSPDSGLFLDLIDPSINPPGGDETVLMPLVRESWITLTTSQQLSIHRTEEVISQSNLKSSLANFHEVALNLERFNRGFYLADQVNLARERVTNRQTDEDKSRHDLFDLFEHSAGATSRSERAEFEDALAAIGKHEGIDFQIPREEEFDDLNKLLVHVLDASGGCARQVRLDSVDKWWMNVSGAMLAFRKDSGQPVALVPNRFGHFCEVSGDRKTRVTAQRAKTLRNSAWLFYPSLPPDSASLKDLFRVAFRGLASDFTRLILAGMLGGFMTLLPAIILAYVVDEVIPHEDIHQLYLFGAVLVSIALLATLLLLFQKMVLIRIEGRISYRAEAAFWDRMQRLPTKFLHSFAACDLAMRGLAFRTIRDSIESLVIHGVISIAFLAPAFVVAFLYDALLGTVAIMFGLLSLAIYGFIGMRQVAPQHRIIRTTRVLADRLFQIINGISVLRLEGAEGSAYAVWARAYRQRKKAELKQRSMDGHIQALGVAIPILAAAVLYLTSVLSDSWPVSVGDFLVVYMVFIMFQTTIVELGKSFTALAATIPVVGQVEPFLTQKPEVTTGGKSVGKLGGDVRLDRVSFRYDADSPLILNNVSIHAHLGEFIAITGESGAGKSTLFKLMLGIDEPTSGAVYYDGQDLRHLNKKQVRRQMGVIPQSVELHPEDIWDNIVGRNDDTSEESLWRAAQLATVDREIKAMPMKMLTSVGAGLGVTAGGESQRITIARALNGNPRILLLDEATNWLDNESQSRVMENLAQLNATRIVIAHRLSTLRQADRICVLHGGRVVETGNYSELMELEGHFFNLVQRQLL